MEHAAAQAAHSALCQLCQVTASAKPAKGAPQTATRAPGHDGQPPAVAGLRPALICLPAASRRFHEHDRGRLQLTEKGLAQSSGMRSAASCYLTQVESFLFCAFRQGVTLDGHHTPPAMATTAVGRESRSAGHLALCSLVVILSQARAGRRTWTWGLCLGSLARGRRQLAWPR